MLVDKHSTETLKRRDKQVYEIIEPARQRALSSEEYHRALPAELERADAEVYRLIGAEYDRQQNMLQLIAAENQCSRAVLAALGCAVQNKTTEGFVGARFHGGCAVVDRLEALAIDRARQAFGAKYANVQPHSGTSANQIVLAAILSSGDRILSLGMDQGGHVSHGDRVSFAGKFFQVEQYQVDRDSFLLDYEAIAQQARRFRPRLIICGASAYSRVIDFERFRAIADEVNAFLLADVSHISGLIIAGVHPSPVDYAHFTTTSTYKPGGPRGGLIVMGKDFDAPLLVGKREVPLWQRVEKTTFPGFQGTPYLNNIAAKAVFFGETLSDEYRDRQFRIVENAQALAAEFQGLGYDVLTGGTDNHMFLVDVTQFRNGLTGAIAQRSLEDCGIVINMNRLPYDRHCAKVTSGMRLGTPIVTRNGMGPAEMTTIAQRVDHVLANLEILDERTYRLDESLRQETADAVRDLCTRFPMR
ncbi:MAG: serine hydroxymethyltransferase [Sedimentisphaerales bacterium]|nr:serine hydroxymethyltransferase [Sedimentisphaerales bacterium]